MQYRRGWKIYYFEPYTGATFERWRWQHRWTYRDPYRNPRGAWYSL